MPTPIDSFVNEYRFLSNFFPRQGNEWVNAFGQFPTGQDHDRFPIDWMGFTVPTVEHAYQLSKTLDNEEQHAIASARTPGQTKKLGKSVTLRPDWDDVKLTVMAHLVQQKFIRHYTLTRRLLATGDRVIMEGNRWGDTFWGVDQSGEGQNHLGRILMNTRMTIQRLMPQAAPLNPDFVAGTTS